MQYRRPAFTLIELLVVIAIIGILSALVVTQLGASQIKARNATAQSDIAEMGKAVESFRVDDTSLNQVVSNVPGSVDTLNGVAGNMSQIFTGTQAVNGSSSTYAASVSKTPSTAYTYRYVASGTPAAATVSARQLVGAGAGQPLYALCTNLVNAVQPYYCAADGSGAGPSGADQVLAAEGLGNLSSAATNGLAAWYQMEGSGTSLSAVDSSGNGNSGTLTGFTFDGTTNGWVAGKFGKGLLFDGNTDYVLAPDSPSLRVANTVTLSIWINKSSNTYYGMYVTKNFAPSADVNSGWYQLMNFSNTGKISFRITSDRDDLVSNSLIPLHAWTLITATYDGTTGKIYINGVLDNSITKTVTPSQDTTPLDIGGRSGASYANNAVFDDARIYSRALSANEVQQLYQGTL